MFTGHMADMTELLFMQVAYLIDTQHETYYVHCYYYDYDDYYYYYYYYYYYLYD